MILAIVFIPLSAVFWIPTIAGILYAVTLITYSVTFSWSFVAIVAGILSVITGLLAAAASDSY